MTTSRVTCIQLNDFVFPEAAEFNCPLLFLFFFNKILYIRFKLIQPDAVHMLQISEVVLTTQTGSRGTQACINAAGMIDGVIADLETTVMFAAAGTLNPEPGETFANHRLDKLAYCYPLLSGECNVAIDNIYHHLVRILSSPVMSNGYILKCSGA